MRRETLSQVKAALGPPAYEREHVLLYCGDCLDLMERIRRPVFDLTITSPPYNLGKEYEVELSVSEYVAWCERWLGQTARLTRLGGAFWLNLGYFPVANRAKALPIAYLLWNHVPLFLVQEVVWHYGAGVAARTSFSPRNEKFLWYVKSANMYTFNLDSVRDSNVKYPKQKKNGKLKCNPCGKNPSDVWQFPKVTSGQNRSSRERTAHPAQFPLAVVERIVKACSNEWDLIFDPFLGSGTVAEVAVLNQRYAVGFEIRADYLDMAVHRVDSAYRRLSEQLLDVG